MSLHTKIAWCDATFNPWVGCTQVSPGCAHCYAMRNTLPRVLRARGRETWGPGAPRHRTSAANWRLPHRWQRTASPDHTAEHPWFAGPRPRIFCGSLCDWLDPEVPAQWLSDLLVLLCATPALDWLLLTKRPQLWRERMQAVAALSDDGALLAEQWLAGRAMSNVWVGATIEDQARAEPRHRALMAIPAAVHFASCEPLLEAIDLLPLWQTHGYPEWVIIGGESGPQARPCHLEWIRALLCQAAHAKVAAFVKQIGSRPLTYATSHSFLTVPGAGEQVPALPYRQHHPKGGDLAEWPTPLHVRQWPHLAA